MTDLTRRTLKTWAAIEALYGLSVAGLVAGWIPWKTPTANALLLAYAALCLAAAPGLWKRRRWGWKLALATGTLGLTGALAVCGGLVASWAYLHGIWDDFGTGASIAAWFLIGCVFQVLGLVPALKLRALLRREVRADMGSPTGIVTALLLLPLLPLLTALGVHHHVALRPVAAVPEAARRQATEHLRAALEGQPGTPLVALEGIEPGTGPLYVSLWDDGQLAARVTGEGEDLAAAVAQAAAQLSASPAAHRHRTGVLKLERTAAVGPVPATPALLAMSLNPGLDGLRRTDTPPASALLPDDMIKAGAFGQVPAIRGIKELRIGLDVAWALEQLPGNGTLQRFRTEEWIETSEGVLAAARGNTSDAATGPAAWRTAALEGGDYALRQLQPDRRFTYKAWPTAGVDRASKGYSLARHAGMVYVLAHLTRQTGERRFVQQGLPAALWLAGNTQTPCGTGTGSCLAKPKATTADLGESALAAIALLEWVRVEDNSRLRKTARDLATWVRDQQQDNGDFFHEVDRASGERDPQARHLFASEEAALAMVQAAEVLGDPAWLDSARAALDFLSRDKYGEFFLGNFVYGADAWTCLAAEEAWPALDEEAYLDFCLGYARFLQRIQYQPGDWANGDFAGHYGFAALAYPQAPGAAGFGEAVAATAALARHHGRPAPDVEAQSAIGLDALVREQIRPANSWLLPDPEAHRGAIRRSLIEQEARIDFTQHAVSALIRGAQLTD